MEKKKTCEIVQDLMPLYVDGACTQGSTEMVESHMTECEKCRKQYEEMSAPLPTEDMQVMPEKDMKVKKAFKKIWCVGLAAIVFAMLISPVWFYWNRHMPEFGLNAENKEEYEAAKQLMYDWITYGYETAVSEMEPLELYRDLSEPLTAEELNWWMGVYEAKEPVYVSFEIGGNVYYMKDYGTGFTWENPVTEDGLAMADALEKGDDTAFWYALWCEYERNFIATEEIYEKVKARYDHFDADGFVEFEQGGKRYYWYAGELSKGEILPEFPDFTADMYRVVEGIHAIDNDFAYIMGTMFLPEALYEECMRTYGQIRDWYDAYAAYYGELGYEEFAKQWKEALMAEFAHAKNRGITPESYTISEDDGLYQATGDAQSAWRVICEVTFSNGQEGVFCLYVDNGHCYLFDYTMD